MGAPGLGVGAWIRWIQAPGPNMGACDEIIFAAFLTIPKPQLGIVNQERMGGSPSGP